MTRSIAVQKSKQEAYLFFLWIKFCGWMKEERHLRQQYYPYINLLFLLLKTILFSPEKLLNKVSEKCLFSTFKVLGLITAWPAQ